MWARKSELLPVEVLLNKEQGYLVVYSQTVCIISLLLYFIAY